MSNDPFAGRCSTLARQAGEPLAGTAPQAQAWLLVEQSGPWGARALTSSHLPHEVGAALAARTADLPVTAVLVRSPGSHADRHEAARPRRVWLGYVGDARPRWLLTGSVADPARVLDLDLAATSAGVPPDAEWLAPDAAGPLLAVCTNGQRDACCALRGRPLAATLAERFPGRVWEASHLGGHRLAPTVLRLPDGFVFAGPDAGGLGPAASRGRSGLTPDAQVAELAALAAWGLGTPVPTDVAAEGPVGDGPLPERGIRVTLGERTSRLAVATLPWPDRPESCGKPPVPAVTRTARRLDTG